MSITVSEPHTGSSFQLHHLSTEGLGIIANYLDFYDLETLIMIGCSVLSSKLRQGVTKIEAKIPSLRKWPISAFKYTHLRSLRVTNLNNDLSTPIMFDNDLFIPHEGHKLLERLEIHSLVASWLLRSRPGHPPLDTLLPHLKTLHLTGRRALESLHLQNLPRKITDLKMVLQSSDKDSYIDDISLLQLLPSGLQSLDLSKTYLRWQSVDRIVPSKGYLPASLTSLSLYLDFITPLLNSLPPCITRLCILQENDDWSIEKVKISSLPRFLEDFMCSAKTALFIIDAPFPSTLRRWMCAHAYKVAGAETELEPPNVLALLPPSITQYCLSYSYIQSMDLQKHLPNLKTIHLPNVGDHPTTIPPVSEFETQHGNMVKYLPMLNSNLVSLSSYVLNSSESLQVFSKLVNLKILKMTPPFHCMPSLLFWKVMQDRLEVLHAEIGQFETLEDLCGPWKFLRDLHLVLYDESTMPQDFFVPLPTSTSINSSPTSEVRYPSSLTRLRLQLAKFWDIFLPPIIHLKSLTKLSMRQLSPSYVYGPNAPKSSLPEEIIINQILTNLPASLTTLKAYLPCPIYQSSMQCLPKRLRNIVMSSPSTWTTDHLLKLPPYLASLKIYGSTTVDLHPIESFLPKTLALIEVGPHTGVATPARLEVLRQTQQS